MPRKIDLSQVRRVLVIKPSALGDVAQSVPVAHVIKDNLPDCRLDWLVNRAYVPMLEGVSSIDEVVPFDRKTFRGPGSLFTTALKNFLADLRNRRYDLVIDLQGLFRSGWMTRATRAPMRVGFKNARELAHLFYTVKVPVPSMEVHALERCLSVLEHLGMTVGRPLRWDLPQRTDDARRVRDMIDQAFGPPEGSGPLVGICPTTRWVTKHWPAEHFADTAAELVRRHGARIVLDGAPGDEPVTTRLAERVQAAVGEGHVLDLTGKTSLGELIALIGLAEVFLTNDSGPMHIADALGTPLVALFGPTNPVRTGPYRQQDHVVRLEVDCAPCYRRQCNTMHCLTELAPEKVLAVVERILAEPSR